LPEKQNKQSRFKANGKYANRPVKMKQKTEKNEKENNLVPEDNSKYRRFRLLYKRASKGQTDGDIRTVATQFFKV
jgi:hypothetical protein